MVNSGRKEFDVVDGEELWNRKSRDGGDEEDDDGGE